MNKEDDSPKETFKWSIGNSKYEIHSTVLSSIAHKDLIPHCLSVRHHILNNVSSVNHKGPSLFRVFPRTLSIVLQGTWDNIIDDDANQAETTNNFDARIRDFIAAHCAEEDRYEAVQELRKCRKPRTMIVQTFKYELQARNGYIEWLPGNEPALNDDQIKQALHDAMPPSWKERCHCIYTILIYATK